MLRPEDDPSAVRRPVRLGGVAVPRCDTAQPAPVDPNNEDRHLVLVGVEALEREPRPVWRPHRIAVLDMRALIWGRSDLRHLVEIRAVGSHREDRGEATRRFNELARGEGASEDDQRPVGRPEGLVIGPAWVGTRPGQERLVLAVGADLEDGVLKPLGTTEPGAG